MDYFPEEIIIKILEYIQLSDLINTIISKKFMFIIKRGTWDKINLVIRKETTNTINNYNFNFKINTSDFILSKIKKCKSLISISD